MLWHIIAKLRNTLLQIQLKIWWQKNETIYINKLPWAIQIIYSGVDMKIDLERNKAVTCKYIQKSYHSF